jgi:hypothetical protein
MSEIDETLSDSIRAALLEPRSSSPAARAMIMDRVRASAPPRRGALRPTPSRWSRRGVLSGAGVLMSGLILMASFGIDRWSTLGAPALLTPIVRVIGDSVVPLASRQLGESLLDTLHVVDVVMRGSSIRSARVIVHDRAAPAIAMRETEDGEWHARVLTPPDVLPVAVVVNELRVMPIPRSVQLSDTL